MSNREKRRRELICLDAVNIVIYSEQLKIIIITILKAADKRFVSGLQLKYTDKVDGLVLINCTSGKSTWTEWGLQKVYHFLCALTYGLSHHVV